MLKNLLLAFVLSLFCAVSAWGQAGIANSGGNGVPNTPPYLPNIPVVSPNIACDGTTDNQPAIQAAINGLEALSPPGGAVYLPACNQIAIGSNILINKSNIYIVGVGGSGTTAVTGSSSRFVGVSIATSVLKWIGSVGGTMLTFDPAASGDSIKNGGLYGVVFAGMTTASIGVDLRSSDGVRFQNVTVENTTTTGINMNITGNTLAAQAVLDVQHGWLENVNLLQTNVSVASATCMVLDGGAAADTSFMHFGHVFCSHQNGHGLVCNNADSNVFDDLTFFNPPATTGYDMVFNKGSSSASGVACRYNHVKSFNTSANSNGIYAFCPVGDSAPSHANRVDSYRQPADNSPITLQTPQQDVNGIETPCLTFTTTTGITNAGPASDANLLINGDFRIDQWHEFASVSLTTGTRSGTFALDHWHFATAGLSSKINSQGVAAGGTGANSRSQQATTSVTATPTAAQGAALCQYIEGNEITNLGFGAAAAKNLVLGFWAKASVTGNYSVFLTSAPGNFAATRTYLISYNVPVAGTWYYYNYVIPGDTGGTWTVNSASAGMGLCFDYGMGSNFQTSTLNTWGSSQAEHTGDVQLIANSGATLSLSQVRLRVGNADAPWQPKPYEVELGRAQRYFAKTFPLGTAPAQNAGIAGVLQARNPIASGDPAYFWQFPMLMRAAPTITTYNPSAANANWRDITAAADVTVSVDPATVAGTNGVLLATGVTVTTLGDVLGIHATADAEY